MLPVHALLLGPVPRALAGEGGGGGQSPFPFTAGGALYGAPLGMPVESSTLAVGGLSGPPTLRKLWQQYPVVFQQGHRESIFIAHCCSANRAVDAVYDSERYEGWK